ncbi:hypothetical protein FAA97_15090 [Peteryoungia ipomoeae]|uniref:Uncharacterized protein n=1 Tax=Peteryoungia ipomoeae TaxID=1210932 RepID=A0A4S8NXF3_9HYPH|nr:hypothetical protein FAA97_15090 [Peteryoungia ipomoeae]
MLFGRSLFQSVVDRLLHEAESAEEAVDQTGTDFRIRGFGAGFVAARPAAASTDSASRSADAYLEIMEDFKPEPPPAAAEIVPTPPIWINRLSPEEIGADLAISADDDSDTLMEKRRIFARENHPDRVDLRFADAATTRMKIANLLIDDAIRARRLQSCTIPVSQDRRQS